MTTTRRAFEDVLALAFERATQDGLKRYVKAYRGGGVWWYGVFKTPYPLVSGRDWKPAIARDLLEQNR